MSALGGSIEGVTIGGRLFPVAADTDANVKLGGKEVELAPNGDGHSAREIHTAVTWQISGLNLEIDDDRGDHEFLQDIADTPGYKPITMTMSGSRTLEGRGKVTGEIQRSTQNATATVSLSGPGKLRLQ